MAQWRERKSTRTPQRASKREPNPEPTRPIFLPPELKLAIIGCMGKYELKTFRLVSREWSMFATPLLFDKVYISPRMIDLTAFNNITQHPVLGPVVREVIYDTSRFQDRISRRDYFDRLCGDLIYCFVHHNLNLEWRNHPLISDLKSGNSRAESLRDELYERHRKDDFVRSGYKRWRRYAKSERWTGKQTVLFSIISKGMQRSNRVRSFSVIGNLWENHLDQTTSLDKHFSGPPSIRRWHALHARPRLDVDNNSSYSSFTDTIIALQSIRPVVSLSMFKGMRDFGIGLAPTALKQCWKQSFFTSFLDVCIHFESFSLNIETDETDDCAAPKFLGVLPRILYRMKHLKRLDLGLSTEASPNSDTCNTYEQVFPEEGRWLQLVDLEIAGLSIGGYQLVRMLSRRFPRLQNLSLRDIELVDGSWEGVIEGMRHTLHLQSLSLGDELGRLRQPSGHPFRTTNPAILHELEEYVVSGGKHPSLSTDVSAEEASNFWLDICPPKEGRKERAFFQQRQMGI